MSLGLFCLGAHVLLQSGYMHPKGMQDDSLSLYINSSSPPLNFCFGIGFIMYILCHSNMVVHPTIYKYINIQIMEGVLIFSLNDVDEVLRKLVEKDLV